MSSIIVLDSSDEDESPPKKANLKSTPDGGNISNVTNTTASKNQNSKQRTIPSGITITPRLSPTAITANSSNLQSSNSSLAGSHQTLNSIINNERHTPTPPKAQASSNSNQRKRKTPTPPQNLPRLSARSFGTMSNSSPAKAATTLAPLPPIMPMITGVHSMAAAGATPPLQLMATPPHGLGSFMGLNEQLMINPHLIPSILPPNTTITSHTNPNQNNINNNFKIHLPFNKPNATTPSPAASPASSAPKTPSPQLTPSPQPSRADKNAKRVKPTTLLRSSDESWQKYKHMSQTDKQSQRTPVSLNNDVVIEMLPPSTESPKSISASSSRLHTPMSSPTTPKSQKSPDVIMITTPTEQTSTSRRDCGAVLDLTHSPDKVTAPNVSEIVDLVNTPDKPAKQINGDDVNIKPDKKPEKPPPKPPLEPEYEELIKTCREADPSKDMEKLIKSKLIKYYYEVHSDYVKSKSFRKNIRKVVDAIKAKPDLVYYNLKTIVEELKVRRKAIPVDDSSAAANVNATAETLANTAEQSSSLKTNTAETDIKAASKTEPATATSSSAEVSAIAVTSTGNKKVDEQIKKLNKALYVLTKRIEVLEQSDVDWDDDDSSYLQVERFKKRACQIYEKICDLTGESKNAHRLVKKPIKFNETRIPQFNKTLQAFINRTKEFPDYFDVLRMLEHCNRTYSLGLVNFEIKNIAEDAFIKVGKLLQSRRKADLYEMVTHFAGDGKDPAKTDPSLAAKLNENLKNHKRISDILEKFARKQDMPDEEEEEKSEALEDNSQEGNRVTGETVVVVVKNEAKIADTPSSDDFGVEDGIKKDANSMDIIKTEEAKIEIETPAVQTIKMVGDGEGEEEEEDDDEEEDEDEENLDEQVETLANGDISDNESDNEIVHSIDNNTNNSVIASQAKSDLNHSDGSLDGSDKNEFLATDFTSEKDISDECIEISDNTQVISSTDLQISAIKINSETESLLLINNNNLDVATNTTKTAKEATPPSSPTLLAAIIHTRNGKLKDKLCEQLSDVDDDDDQTTNILTPKNPSIINTSTIAATTKTADLKIIHVSSLKPDSNIVGAVNNDDQATVIKRNEVANKLSSTNKSLEEIVISDEES